MKIDLHPLSGGSPYKLWSRLQKYGCDRGEWPKVALALAMGFLGEPGRFVAKNWYRKTLDDLEITEAPVFIIGHWRSGTTYLHHLLSLDPSFCYVSSYHAWLPELFIVNDWLGRNIVKLNMPERRPMDNIELSLDKPEEEEFPLATTSDYSYIDSFYFPKNTREIFNKSVLFKGLSPQEYEQWKADYVRILKFCCLSMPGSRPLLKSPANTARISTLLEMFPTAKFVHIYRNPYNIFASKLHTLKRMTKRYGLQSVDEAELEHNVLWIYQEVMKTFFDEQSLIPPENFVEICYEELEQDSLAVLERIYDKFDLGEFDAIRPRLEQYIDSQKGYQKNPHCMSPEMVEKIYKYWSFTIDKWGYQAP